MAFCGTDRAEKFPLVVGSLDDGWLHLMGCVLVAFVLSMQFPQKNASTIDTT
jgi:hypothetical protein